MKYVTCPQCGEDTETLDEGYCEPCRVDNQQRLDKHNFEFDQWQKMNDKERDEAIKMAR